MSSGQPGDPTPEELSDALADLAAVHEQARALREQVGSVVEQLRPTCPCGRPWGHQ